MASGISSGPDAAEGRVIPTCYRHPDRETYIRCTRCERPICPDCMNAAPVGFQCPECVAAGNKAVRQARTPLGGEIVGNRDLVTKTLIAINAAVFLVGLAGFSVTARLGLFFLASYQGEPIGVADGEWWRVLTATFVHDGFLHLALNMYALWVLGSLLEPVLGRWRFTALYVLSALAGSALSLMFLAPGQASVGASGAVYGLFGAALVVTRRFGGSLGGLAVVLAINLAISFAFPGIDWRAHVGGLAVGTALAAVFAYAPRRQRTAAGVAACLLALAVIVLLVADRANDLPF